MPCESSHRHYTQTVLDWPLNGKQGQVQNAYGLACYDVGVYDVGVYDVGVYDVDVTSAANPGANVDRRLLPVLEIEMPAESANLPPAETCSRDDGSPYSCYPLLDDFSISLRTVAIETLAAPRLRPTQSRSRLPRLSREIKEINHDEHSVIRVPTSSTPCAPGVAGAARGDESAE